MKAKAKKDPKEKAHAVYGPSSAERWSSCAASIEHEKTAPPGQDSPWAKEGNDAHFCLESFLLNARRQGIEKVAKFLSSTYPSEMIDHAAKAYSYIIRRLAEFPGALLFAEEKVDISHFTAPDQFGTLDVAIVEEFGRLVVMDFKYGAGIVVDPEENKQLICYALAVAKKFDYNFIDVELVVIQPRAEHHTGNTIRSWTIPIAELVSWEKFFIEAVKKTKDPLAEFNPGDHCRFCRGKVTCPAISTLALKQAQADFDDETGELVSVPEPTKVGVKNLPEILKACDRLETWIDSVRSHAFYVLEKGGKVPGFKLVPKRSTRRWVSEKVAKEAKKTWGEVAFSPPELLSPAQLEKVLEEDYEPTQVKTWIKKRVSDVSSGFTLVTEDDKRQAVNPMEKEFPELPKVSKAKTVKKKGKKK